MDVEAVVVAKQGQVGVPDGLKESASVVRGERGKTIEIYLLLYVGEHDFGSSVYSWCSFEYNELVAGLGCFESTAARVCEVVGEKES